MWFVAAAFAGVAWGWPAVLMLLKPTLAPFALIGVRRRSWWIALGVLVVVSVPFGAMWLDYSTALLDAQNGRGLEYTLGEWPLMIAPLAAWLGSVSSHRGGRTPADPSAAERMTVAPLRCPGPGPGRTIEGRWQGATDC